MNIDDDEDWLQAVLFDQPNPASSNEGNDKLQSQSLNSSRVSPEAGQRRTGHKRNSESKTDPQQLEAQKRWRQREKMRIQDLQAELEAKAAQAEALTTLNTALERKQQLLESVLAIRDDQLRALQREAATSKQQQLPHTNTAANISTATQQHPTHTNTTDTTAGSHAQHAIHSSQPTTQSVMHESENHQQNKELQPQNQHNTQLQGNWLKEPPSPENPLVLKRIPPHHLWDAGWMARMRQVTPEEWRAMWQDFVKESSMYVLAAEAHGPGSEAYSMLTQIVSHYLGVLDRITLLTPAVYYQSLYMNLMTGEKQPPPDGHWAIVAKAIGTTPQQVHECLTALQSFESTMQQVMKERAELAARISQQLSASNTHNVAGLPAPQLQHEQQQVVQNHHYQQQQQQQLQNHQYSQQQQQQQQQQTQLPHVEAAVRSKDNTIAGHGELAGRDPAGAAQLPVSAAAGGMPSCSIGDADLAHLTQQLSSNVSKEHAAHNTISDFLCTRVLNVVQLSRAAAVSWPWLPDVTAILKEGLAAMNVTNPV